eukprot:gene7169-16860_t
MAQPVNQLSQYASINQETPTPDGRLKPIPEEEMQALQKAAEAVPKRKLYTWRALYSYFSALAILSVNTIVG